MTPSSVRRAGFGLCAVLVVGLVAALWLSMPGIPRPAPRPAAESGQAQVANSTDLDTPALEPIRKPSPPRNDYVGSASCAECHPKIAKQYSSHSMAKSMEAAVSANSQEDFGDKATFAADANHVYSVEMLDGEMRHHERLLDSQLWLRNR